MTTSIQNHNLAIWSAVEKTDPAHTRPFKRPGGFSGTMVVPIYQVKRATELFGPLGIGWGFDELEHKIVDGAAGDKVWFSKVKVWYQHDGRRGEVVQWGATMFVGTTKNGPFTDDEAGKKSITDAVGKCLSLLGFSADVYQGQFDDQKYVNDRRREEAAKRQVGGRRQTVDRDAQASGSAAPAPSTQPKGTRTSREASPPANGNGHAPASSPSTVYRLPPTDPDPDLAAFRDAIAAAETESEAQRAERLLRSQRALAGRSISDVESSLIASCTEAACQRIRALGHPEGTRRKASGANGHAGQPVPDLAEFASPSTTYHLPPTNNGPVTGEHLSQPRGSGTAHPHGKQHTVDGDAQASVSPPSTVYHLPSTNGGLAADVAAFRDFCAQALAVTDVKRGEHVLRSQRLRDRIGLGDAESELIAGWADAACRRIKAARRSNS